ncbi:MAG: EAL domain-containing protein [Firmicutes bacterium]|nr:EAL domain-containing protein [Bacillota bacterium]
MFIARQPIFNRNLGVYGYELLFRSDAESGSYDGISPTKATATVISGLFECGIECIVEDKYAFINFDEKFIHSDSLELIEADRLIVEILEDVSINDRLIRRIKDLKGKGYKIALDDFYEDYDEYPLVPYADIIKFDLIVTPLEEIKGYIHTALTHRKTILAEKIETEEDFLKAKEMGFHLFQGYFFSKPGISNKPFDKSTSKTQYYRLLKELKKEEPSFQELAEIIEKDVTLAYRLMRVVSSRSGDELIYSIKKALTYMGLRESERWVHILMLQDFGKEKPKELMRTSLIRTQFAETIAIQGGLKNLRHEASMMGLFSVLDAMMDMPLSTALEGINLTKRVLDALLYNKGVLYPIYELILAYEKADWEIVLKNLKEMGIDKDSIHEKYLDAINWAKETMGLIA